MQSRQKKYVRLTLGQKAMLCKMAAEHPGDLEALADLAVRAFDLPKVPSSWTLRKMLKDSPMLRKLPEDTYAHKNIVNPTMDAFDRALLDEFDRMEKELKTVTDHALLFRAKHFVDEGQIQSKAKRPGFSKGWLHRFKQRFGIRSRRKQVEMASVNLANAINGRADMRKLTDLFALKGIYIMDKSSFFYHEEAPRTLSRRSKVPGYKADKTRLTIALAVNADGSDKLPLLFIGKSVNPRAFKGHDVSAELGVEYTNSTKAWMNSVIFSHWLRDLDSRMKQEDHHILLLVDNVSSHVRPLEPLTNVRLEFLPKNTTSVLQPLDQGIILCVKRGFSRIKVETSVLRFMQRLPQEKISIFTALQWAKNAWDEVIPDTIAHCWQHSGIVARPSSSMSLRQILSY